MGLTCSLVLLFVFGFRSFSRRLYRALRFGLHAVHCVVLCLFESDTDVTFQQIRERDEEMSALMLRVEASEGRARRIAEDKERQLR